MLTTKKVLKYLGNKQIPLLFLYADSLPRYEFKSKNRIYKHLLPTVKPLYRFCHIFQGDAS